jgi:hypothetical protein
MSGNLPLQSQQMFFSQQPHHHIQANAFLSQPEFNNNWTEVPHKHGRTPQDETETKTKHNRESECWLNQSPISNCNTCMLKQLLQEFSSSSLDKPIL